MQHETTLHILLQEIKYEDELGYKYLTALIFTVLCSYLLWNKHYNSRSFAQVLEIRSVQILSGLFCISPGKHVHDEIYIDNSWVKNYTLFFQRQSFTIGILTQFSVFVMRYWISFRVNSCRWFNSKSVLEFFRLNICL